ncbi:SUMO-activating enzyme subunit 2 (Ubiquitin-like 1-activating enzyme E1B) (Ubiquitin-like modifier-activating enzyme 2) [Durusdinium trenchii]|uniref:SUMO-activating enzyme subunit 2 (Ubiquitin-like 1-activating enzyme E1B) (Ubiquitin-like modifier-activating enzyme 2) n=1 Tax=Durusdinium trenchii TaxID=1381693 RepID=A0ABP0HD99_9DINO
MGRYAHLERALGAEVFAEVTQARVLVVGAGGIGCELLKDLVLTGFRDIEVIDLDTIDTSNLNRQFLFRSKHVGKPKSLVAREAAMGFNPDVNIKAFLGNIKADEFGIQYFQTFDIVLNALDNVNARQHVNRLCLAANLPLIDSGTTGYLGQTTVIKKGETQCYDCQPKTENKKSFPICTIRSTPDKPVHCIVWAKELFKLMFGNPDESMLSGSEDDFADDGAQDGGDEAAEAGKGEGDAASGEDQQKEREIRSQIVDAVLKAKPEGADADDADKVRAYARGVFDAVFDNEIHFKLKLRNGYKGAKKKPTPLPFDEAMAATDASDPSSSGLRDQRVLSLNECAELFLASVAKLWAPARRKDMGSMEFDKDDREALDFVAAASNLRSHIFGIERKSIFETKGIAGNIIHAIATTNAIVAGIQIVEAIKILARLKGKKISHPYFTSAPRPESSNSSSSSSSSSNPDASASPTSVTSDSTAVWVVRDPIGSGNLLQATNLDKPNPNCYSCGNSTMTLSVDATSWTLGDLVDKILRKSVGINAPSIMLKSSEIYAEGDGLEEDEIELFKANLPKTLVDCPAGGIKDGTILDIEDFSQSLSFKLIISQKDDFDKDANPDQFELSGDAPVSKAAESSPDEAQSNARGDDADDGDLEVVEGPTSATAAVASKKRPAENAAVPLDESPSGSDSASNGSKKPKVSEDVTTGDNGVICLD